MKRIFFVLFALVLLFSCKKEDDKDVIYELTIVNNSDNPYSFKIIQNNNIFKTIEMQGNSFSKLKLPENFNASWESKQISGYVLYPSIFKGVIHMDKDRLISFP